MLFPEKQFRRFQFHLRFLKARSLQCGYWPQNSQILILILPWISGGFFLLLFPRQKAQKIHKKIPRKIQDFVRKIPLGFLQKPFLEDFAGSWKPVPTVPVPEPPCTQRARISKKFILARTHEKPFAPRTRCSFSLEMLILGLKFHSRLKISIPGPVFLQPEKGTE